ncbi:glutamate racemase [Acidovorax sp. NCPPB 4044]|uniref:glutamate racemase n=1 Tax=Acidovorax sp. NCPPB 4044 TaxID=2940490 RepID=UPI002303A344|nr:glutamate racemase [Acidovorax sp. NCPPB 4044]MDA8520014.1 glutamate racemase [Acidovorax sp. NCPPB 4044]
MMIEPSDTGPGAPIGVFDSGVGGLSVLRTLRAALPHERFVYLADSAHAPYGERGDGYVAARTRTIARHLRQAHGIKALVVACNTATAAAIHEARSQHPDLPLVGVEPALKPAVALTRTGRVGVIATRGTLASAKFQRLLASLAGPVEFVVQPCDGLAYAIERSTADTRDTDPATIEIRALCERYTAALGRFGTEPGSIDTLVLGCTHYVFAEAALRSRIGPEVRLVETGEPVARQTRRLLEAAGALAPAHGAPLAYPVRLFTTGELPLLQAAARRWLDLPPQACALLPLPTVEATENAPAGVPATAIAAP